MLHEANLIIIHYLICPFFMMHNITCKCNNTKIKLLVEIASCLFEIPTLIKKNLTKKQRFFFNVEKMARKKRLALNSHYLLNFF